MIILGIDPGLTCTGWAIVEATTIIAYGEIESTKSETILDFCNRVEKNIDAALQNRGLFQYPKAYEAIVEWPFERNEDNHRWSPDHSGMSLAKLALVSGDLRARYSGARVTAPAWQGRKSGGYFKFKGRKGYRHSFQGYGRTELQDVGIDIQTINEHEADAIGLALWYGRRVKLDTGPCRGNL